eukprot:NODE_1758_length_769_cov_56.455556_g1469_i0.p1 GENE.NODE_1758_length_769_cov_56.455556_g1469_i0~~NODE_1758_length_769_cov_56.455556_g1469_i0.p1  ORF type:complete len:205 (+),score=51.66 NODE_1758_length_769_cov_56.455556_g1469_i0:32-616(+)
MGDDKMLRQLQQRLGAMESQNKNLCDTLADQVRLYNAIVKKYVALRHLSVNEASPTRAEPTALPPGTPAAHGVRPPSQSSSGSHHRAVLTDITTVHNNGPQNAVPDRYGSRSCGSVRSTMVPLSSGASPHSDWWGGSVTPTDQLAVGGSVGNLLAASAGWPEPGCPDFSSASIVPSVVSSGAATWASFAVPYWP